MIDIVTIPFKKLSLEGAGFTNPRKSCDSKSIAELASSIEKHGLMVPLRVWTPLEDPELHIIIAGSRRYLAIEKLIAEKREHHGLKDGVPCILASPESKVEDTSGDGTESFSEETSKRYLKVLLMARVDALSDNIQRESLSSYEIADEMAYLKESGLKGKDIASLVGKSEAWVSRALGCLRDVSEPVKSAWKTGKVPDETVQDLAKLRCENEDGKTVPDHAEMDRRLDKILAHRAAAAPKTSQKEKAAARSAAKAGSPKAETKAAPVRPKAELLTQFIAALEKAPKVERYLHGVRDGLRFAIGDLGPGEFGKEFAAYAEKKGFYDENQPVETPKKAKDPTPLERTGAPKKEKDGRWKVEFSTDVEGVAYVTYYSSRTAARAAKASDKVGENGRVA